MGDFGWGGCRRAVRSPCGTPKQARLVARRACTVRTAGLTACHPPRRPPPCPSANPTADLALHLLRPPYQRRLGAAVDGQARRAAGGVQARARCGAAGAGAAAAHACRRAARRRKDYGVGGRPAFGGRAALGRGWRCVPHAARSAAAATPPRPPPFPAHQVPLHHLRGGWPHLQPLPGLLGPLPGTGAARCGGGGRQQRRRRRRRRGGGQRQRRCGRRRRRRRRAAAAPRHSCLPAHWPGARAAAGAWSGMGAWSSGSGGAGESCRHACWDPLPPGLERAAVHACLAARKRTRLSPPCTPSVNPPAAPHAAQRLLWQPRQQRGPFKSLGQPRGGWRQLRARAAAAGRALRHPALGLTGSPAQAPAAASQVGVAGERGGRCCGRAPQIP